MKSFRMEIIKHKYLYSGLMAGKIKETFIKEISEKILREIDFISDSNTPSLARTTNDIIGLSAWAADQVQLIASIERRYQRDIEEAKARKIDLDALMEQWGLE